MTSQPPKLLDQVRGAIRARHYSRRTEEAYVHWIRRFILFHGKRHPREMGEAEVTAFLTMLAVREQVSASTQTLGLSALVFLYRAVLRREIGAVEGLPRARGSKHVPIGCEWCQVHGCSTAAAMHLATTSSLVPKLLIWGWLQEDRLRLPSRMAAKRLQPCAVDAFLGWRYHAPSQ